ncbi:hypothetical protein [Amycolatopsis echigonensis]|uniref:Uncharacterized protein n=1 Tax=Amycolatopsis echigonensis TaxID=2576905 RepID=A0A8E1VUS8_9PSEU|nr:MULTISPECIES: hypothetical protein [Amycolatopsis]MBB2498642.1 hypothetical protein [Amycolatopsis echigonensis]
MAGLDPATVFWSSEAVRVWTSNRVPACRNSAVTVVLPAVGSSRTNPVTPTARLYQVNVPPVRLR